MKKRITAFLLVLVMLLPLVPTSFAAPLSSYGDSVNIMIRSEEPHSYLDVNRAGSMIPLSARVWSYITADGLTQGPAYCVEHGEGYPNGYITVDLTPYTQNPTMMAAFSSGHPFVSLEDFKSAHSDMAALTHDEYGYATQLAVWAALDQLSVEGTTFTRGAETVTEPTGDSNKLRIFNALKYILAGANAGGNSNVTGLHIRASETELGDTVDLGSAMSLSTAAEENSFGIQKETIGGVEYATREFTVSSATEPAGGRIGMTLDGAPSGTILASTDGTALESVSGTWFAAVSAKAVSPDISSSGTEYSARFKVCVPLSAAATTGNLAIRATASASSVTFYYVENAHTYEQNFIIADPDSSTATAAGYLKWGETGIPEPETASIRVLKTGNTGEALPGARFELVGSGGYYASGVSDANGQITWTNLPVDQTYTVSETSAPEGYEIVDPVNVTVTGGQTSYVTIQNYTNRKFRLHKHDAQNGAALGGALFRFEQINGDFVTEGRTLSDGILMFTSEELPYGSYRVTELLAPEGYEPDTEVRTVHWDGRADVDLYFENVRKPSFDILKVDADTGVPLAGAVFSVYKDGVFLTSARSNAQGIATISGVTAGYYEVEEIVAPDGYVLDSSRHGVYIDPYDPASSAEQIIRLTNRARPALRILKYDGVTREPIAGTLFEVYRDTVLMGSYTTDAQGEIDFYDLEPGTYLVQEIATDDDYVVFSTPQQVQLEAGVTETYTLVFLNYLKPGIHLRKVDAETLQPVPNARFRITRIGGSYSEEHITGTDGEIDLDGLEPGTFEVVELAAPDGYLIDNARRIITINAGENAEFVFTNTRQPSLKLIKVDSLTGERLPGATFRIAKIGDEAHSLDRITDANGEINVEDLLPGIYSVQETAAPAGYILDTTEYHVELFAGQMSQLVISNQQQPDLRIIKKDAKTGEYLDGAVFQIKRADSVTITAEETNENGEIVLENLEPGVYEVTELRPPAGYLPAREASQLVTLEANRLATAIFTNYEQPTLTLKKISSVSGEPLEGVKFRITYRSNNTETGSMNDLGYYLTDENGEFYLTGLTDGWYTITEVETLPGYSIPEPAYREVYIRGGEDATVVFENTPLSGLIGYKFDTVTGEAISNVPFQVRRLSDTSGTGGTVIGTYLTGPTGSFTVTGLQMGTYIVEELASDGDHVADSPPQTVYLSGQQMEVVSLYFGNTPKGSLLLKKIDATTHEPLQGVQFFVTDSNGAVVGAANGYFTTDSTGTVLITGLEPGAAVVAREVRARDGYLLDDAPQTIQVRAGQTVTLEFVNHRNGSLLLRKIDSVTRQPLPDVRFFITDSHGAVVGNGDGYFTTDSSGTIRIDDLAPGTTVIAREVEAKEGYLLDDTPQTVTIRSGETVTLEFRNKSKGTLIVVKRDAITGQPLPGVCFEIKNSRGTFVGTYGGAVTSNGQFVTDSSGQIYISGLNPDTYTVTETETISGYVLNSRAYSIYVAEGDTQTLTITNQPKGNLIIRKWDSVTRQPLAGAQFQITTANGTNVDGDVGLTSSNGLYTTDANGQIRLTRLMPGTYVVTEFNAPEGYQRSAAAQTVVVGEGDTQTLDFYNDPLCTLTILKLDAVTGRPVPGAEFFVRYSDGRAIGTDNGRYTTDRDGTITVTGMTPNATVLVSEESAPAGYVRSTGTRSIVVRSGSANALTFENDPTTTLILHKYVDGTENEPMAGVAFKLIDGFGAPIGPDDGVYYTDAAGDITVTGLAPGSTVIAREIKTLNGYILDGTPQSIGILAGEVQQLTFWNRRQGALVIRKLDSVTHEPISGATFKITTAAGEFVPDEYGRMSSDGLYTTDQAGEIILNGLRGAFVVTEISAAPGYTISEETRSQTVVVEPEDTQTLTFFNNPTQVLTIQKYIAGTTTPLAGVTFLVTDSGGAVLGPNNGEYVTDENGRIVISGLVPGVTVTARETKTVSGYVLDDTPKSILIKEGEAQTLVFTNQPKGSLIVNKLDSVSGNPLPGAVFKITTLAGEPVEDNEGRTGTGGLYTTDANGQIALLRLEPGSYTVTETRAPEGYMPDRSPQTVTVRADNAQTLTFYDEPEQVLTITKYEQGTATPIEGVAFLVTDGSGTPVGSATGEFLTDSLGQIRVNGIAPGTTVIAREVRTVKGYSLNGMPQSLVIQAGANNALTFYDEPLSTLVIHKYIDGTANEPLPGVAFKVTDGSGAAIGNSDGIYYTDQTGDIVIPDLAPGITVTVREFKTVDGFVLNGIPQDILIQSGEVHELTFWNQRQGTLKVRKLDSVSNAPLAGVEFKITYADGRMADTEGGQLSSNGQYFTDSNGEITVTGIVGTLVVTEVKPIEGYTMDAAAQSQTVVVRPDETQTLTFFNTPLQSLIIQKYSAGTETPLPGATFLVTDSGGEMIGPNNGEYTTDHNGRIVIEQLTPDATVLVKEVKAPAGYALSGESQSIKIKTGEAQTLTFFNEPLQTLTIYKYEEGTTNPISGVTFQVTDSNGAPLGGGNGAYVTDGDGKIVIGGLMPGSTVVAREVRTVKGYTLNGIPQTIQMASGGTPASDTANTLTFYDVPLTTLLIHKYIDGTQNEPLPGVAFQVTDSSGAAVGNSDGVFYTDQAGEIVIPNLEPGITVTAREIKTVDGFQLDGTPQDILIKAGDVQELVFWNRKLGTLKIRKLDSVTKEPLGGVEFSVAYASGEVVDTADGHLSSNGVYVIDDNGEITITGITGTLVVTEQQTVPGYTIHPDGRTQTVVVNPEDLQTLTFYNDPTQTLTIQKYVKGSETPVPGTRFLVTDSAGQVVGQSNGEFTTDENGRIVISGLVPGVTVTAKEIEAAEGFALDSTPQSILIQSGDAQTLTFYDTPLQSLIVQKYEEGTSDPIQGTGFLITDGEGNPLGSSAGEFSTDENGRITLQGLKPGMTVIAKEIRAAEGYVLDGESKSIRIESGDVQSLTFYNRPLQTLTIYKYEDGSTVPIPGVTFLVTDSTGAALVGGNGEFVTDDMGRISIGGLTPGSTVVAREIRTVKGFTQNGAPQTLQISYDGRNQEASANTLTFYDTPLTTLLIHKYIDGTQNEPLSGVAFQVTDSSGAAVGNSDGVFYTDQAGEIVIPNLEPGITVTAREIKTVDGFQLDGTPQDILIKAGDVQELVFWNRRLGTLKIRKLDSVTKEPLGGVEFSVAYASGEAVDTADGHLSSNCVYTTDSNGEITITGVTGTLVVTEQKTIPGYTMDPNARTQTVEVWADETQTLTFYNDPTQTLTIQKFVKGSETPVPGARFLVTDSAGQVVGQSNGEFITDEAGRIVISGLVPGVTVTAKEIEAAEGFALDSTPQSILIQSGEAQTLTFYNVPQQSLLVQKYKAGTTEPVRGAAFLLTDGDGNPLGDAGGEFTTDENGQILLTGLNPGMTVTAKEIRAAEGYVLDGEPKSIKIEEGDVQTLTFYNVPQQSLIVQKYVAGTTNPIQGVGLLITDGNGKPLGTGAGEFVTDENGRVTLTNLTPGMTVIVKEIRAAEGFVLDGEPKSIRIESGDAQTLTFFDQPLQTLIIRKYVKGSEIPIPGVRFLVTDSAGEVVGQSNGYFTTDEAGRIVVSGLVPDMTVTAKEIEAAEGFVLDSTPQSIFIQPGDAQTLTFFNEPLQTLTIYKYKEGTTNPISGVTFQVTDSNGAPLGGSGGAYVTDAEGKIVISGLTPGSTVVAREVRTVRGYSLNGMPQSVQISYNGSTQTAEANTLTFYDTPLTTLLIHKYIDGTQNEPLSGVAFKVEDGSGAAVGNSDGVFYTDQAGEIVIPNLEPGITVTAREIKTVDGFQLDGTPQDILIKAGDVQELVFWNQKLGTLKIRKLDSVTKEPLGGVEFSVAYTSGEAVDTADGHLSSNGVYVTDDNGEITITGVTGTLVVTEQKTIPGYTMDPNARTQTVEVRVDETQTLTFYNDPTQTLTIQKYVKGSETPVPGARFLVTDSAGQVVGQSNGEFTTDENGRIVISGLVPGVTVTAKEIEAAEGFALDSTPQSILIQSGEAQTLTFYNVPRQSLLVQKYKAGTTEPVRGAAFLLTDGDGNPLGDAGGEFTTDENGQILLTGLTPGMTVTAKEIRAAEGYVLDGEPKSIKIEEGDVQTLTFYNVPQQSLIVQKYVAGTTNPIQGVGLLITDGNGKPLGTGAGEFVTDENGRVTLTNLTPGMTVIVKEIRAAEGFVLDGEPKSIRIESGAEQTLTIYNTPQQTLFIQKYAEGSNTPLAGVTFLVTDSDGTVLGPNSGEFITDENGRIELTNLDPGVTVVVREIKTVEGYELDSTPKSIKIQSGDAQTLTFYNTPQQTLVIQKYVQGTETPIRGTAFLITDSDGRTLGDSAGEFLTDENGRITLTNLTPGMTVTAREIRSAEGYVLDGEPKSIRIESGNVQTLTFYNVPQQTLFIQKYEAGARKPIHGAFFFITDSDGKVLGEQGGEFMTDETGRITLTNLDPGTTVVAREIRAAEGYMLDGEPKSIRIESGDAQTLTFYNTPLQTLTIYKYEDGSTTPIPGVTFQVTDGNGVPIGGGNGAYVTDSEGKILISGLEPGATVVAREVRTVKGYTLNGMPQTIQISAEGENPAVNSLTFYDTPLTTLLIRKYIDQTDYEPLSGVSFQVVDGSGAAVGNSDGIYYTDHTGEIAIPNLEPGVTITVREVKTVEGFQLDGTPQDILIKAGDVQELVFWNQRLGALKIRKLDSVTKEPLAGVEFTVTYANGEPVDNAGGRLSSNGVYTTDDNGEINITGVTGTLVVTEQQTIPGYTIHPDGRTQTVVVNANDLQTLTFYNDPTQTLTIQKYAAGSETPIPGTRFLITDSSGQFVGQSNGEFTTDENGRIVISGLVPGVTVTAKEIEAAEGFALDSTPKSIKIQSGDAQTLTFYNVSRQTLIIQKYEEGTTTPIQGVHFQITDSDGQTLGREGGDFTTDENGRITLTDLNPGMTVIARETRAAEGYLLNGEARSIKIESGDVQTLTIYNTPLQTLVIQKYAEGTNDPVAGATFLVTDSDGRQIGANSGEFITDENGRILLSNLEPGMTVVVKEIRAAAGYVPDGTPKSIKIQSGEVQTLTFYNTPQQTMVIQKYVKETANPIQGAVFYITDGDGKPVGTSGGEYTTDEKGSIELTNLDPGTMIIAREIRAAEGYVLDGEAKSLKVERGGVQTMTFYNVPLQTLVIQKYAEGSTTPLAGVTFLLTDAAGMPIGSANGEHITDENGRIVVTGLVPGTTVVAREVKTVNGYTLNGNPQTILITENGAAAAQGAAQGPVPAGTNGGISAGSGGNQLTFYDDPLGTLIVHKYIHGTEYEPLGGVTFRITDSTGAFVGPNNGIFTTDSEGSIVLPNLEPGRTIKVQETGTVEGYVLDGEPQEIRIESGTVHELTFWNSRKGSLVIRKLDSVTKEPLGGVEFSILYADGRPVDNANGHVSSNGNYTTNSQGEIVITGIVGTVIVTEEKALPGYTMDPNGRSQTVQVGPEDTQTLVFYNDPPQTLIIQKFETGTATPVQGAAFLVTSSDGTVIGPGNGEYITDRNGRIVIGGLVSGVTVTARETRAAEGFVLNSEPQSILIRQGETQTMTFYNTPVGGLLITKTDAESGERIPGVKFEVQKKNGEILGTYTTDRDGIIRLPGLEQGWYAVIEREAASGYQLDAAPHDIEVKDGQTATLALTNRKSSNILIHKVDAITGKGIGGVRFLLYDSQQNPIGEYVSDNNGYVYMDRGFTDGRYYVREIQAADGYILDSELKTFHVQYGATAEITWKNTAIRGQIQIVKKSANDNPINGLPAGTVLEGAVFEIYDKVGNLVDTIRSDRNGRAVSQLLPLSRYTIKEVQAPSYYSINPTVMTAYLEHEGQIVTFEVLDESVATGVSIKKTGYEEVLPGQSLRYTITQIANTSTVPLSSFYWRDTLPGQIAPSKLVTGTYNQALSYKIVYKTTASGDAWLTLADNLSTSKTYVIDAQPSTLGLASNERVTEIMFVFGTVRAGFAEVETAYLYGTVNKGLANGASIVNVADVGGLYNGQWIQAVSRCNTSVYAKTTYTLPKTGY